MDGPDSLVSLRNKAKEIEERLDKYNTLAVIQTNLCASENGAPRLSVEDTRNTFLELTGSDMCHPSDISLHI